MPDFPRIECGNVLNLTTIRTMRREIWFTQNLSLEEEILGNLAKFQSAHDVTLYGFALEGTHKHEVAEYPECSRADFHRDFNSSIARSVNRHYPERGGGPLWGRKYSNEFLGTNTTPETKFFYTVLQPVQDGLVSDIREYPGYNCFEDAIAGRERMYKVVNWARYNSDKRWKKNISIRDYTEEFPLKYSRLPGYEEYSQKHYMRVMRAKLKKRTKELVAERKRQGLSFMGRAKLAKTKPGQRATSPKTSTRWTHRPRVISDCRKEAAELESWLFDLYYAYHEASYSYRVEGRLDTKFPPGMYKPPLFTVKYKMSYEDIAAS